MANVKISALPAATTPLTGSEELAIVQTGDTVKATIDDVTNAVTLQQVLDNNNDLPNGNNLQGTSAGNNNTGSNVNAFGSNSAVNNTGISINAFGAASANNNTGDYINAMGTSSANFNSGNNVNAFGDNSAASNLGENVNALGGNAAQTNSGNNVNVFGANAGGGNIFNCVNLFGPTASADGDSQTVFVANGAFDNARISYAYITADRKYELPDASGTIALTSDISTYKSYVINLGWNGLAWSVTDTYENTLGGSVTLASGAAGRLRLTTSGLFTSGKTVVIPCVISGQATLLGVLDFAFSSFPNDIYVRWNNASGGIATPTSFGTNIPYILEVRVYN